MLSQVLFYVIKKYDWIVSQLVMWLGIWLGIIGLAILCKMGCSKDWQGMTGYYRCVQIISKFIYIFDSSIEANVILGDLENV